MLKLLRQLSLCLLVGLVSTPAFGSEEASDADKAQARALALQAQAALEAKDCDKAADLFGRAEDLYHAPTLLVGLARAQVCLGQYVEARENYNRVIREGLPDKPTDAFKKAFDDAKAEIKGLDDMIAWAVISVSDPVESVPDLPFEPTVLLDDVALSEAALGVKRAVNPGEHTVKVTAQCYFEKIEKFSVQTGATGEVSVQLERDPDCNAGTIGGGGTGGEEGDGDDPGATQRTIGWVALGLGGAGLIVGGITGIVAIDQNGSLEEACDRGKCPPSEQDNLDSYRTMGTVSTVGFIAGGVLAATGLILVLTAPSGDEPAEEATAPEVSAAFGLGHVQATVRF